MAAVVIVAVFGHFVCFLLVNELSKLKFVFVVPVLVCLVIGWVRADEVVQNRRAVVIAGHPEATRLGMAVLRQGGTAADALVTVSLALGLTEAGNSGPGGKLVMLYYDAAARRVDSLVALDAAPAQVDIARVTAMSSADRKRGYQAACVPGNIAALEAVHSKWGVKDWRSLVLPVAKLADEGFFVNDRCAAMMAEFPTAIDAEAARIFAPGGRSPQPGDTFRNPDYARMCRTLAAEGPRSFYTGTIARQIVAAFEKAGVPFSAEDLANYKVRWNQPLSGSFSGAMVYTAPPPLSGGATVLTAMRVLDGIEWPERAAPRDVAYVDLAARVLQQVYPKVAGAAGDTPGSRAAVEALLADHSIDALRLAARTADPKHPYVSTARTDARDSFEASLDDGEQASTTHLVIVDARGNIACVTQSLGNHFGAAVVPAGTGFLLNNCVNNFAFRNPDSVNYIGGGKWPRSTMAPTIILKDGRPLLAIGSPAGQRIPTAVLQTSIDVLKFGLPLEEAVRAGRFHLRRPADRSEPANCIDLEATTEPHIEAQLQERGWIARRRPDDDFYFGSVNAALIDRSGKVTGVADQRRTSTAGGD